MRMKKAFASNASPEEDIIHYQSKTPEYKLAKLQLFIPIGNWLSSASVYTIINFGPTRSGAGSYPAVSAVQKRTSYRRPTIKY